MNTCNSALLLPGIELIPLPWWRIMPPSLADKLLGEVRSGAVDRFQRGDFQAS
jgi:hypothetical protein